MDHLPRPVSASTRAVGLVPYVCREEYDSKDFLNYPTRIGLPSLQTVGRHPGELSYAHRKHRNSLSREEIESFYQTWLFFGLIHEILGSIYNHNDFVSTIKTDDGPIKVVSTTTLIAKLETWVRQVQEGEGQPPLTYEHIVECMCLTHASLRNVRTDFNSELKLSLVSLGQILGYATSKAFKIGWKDKYQDNKLPLTWGLFIDKMYWKTRLRTSGWCVSQIEILLDTSSSLQTLHFLVNCIGVEGEDRHGTQIPEVLSRKSCLLTAQSHF